jgi:hypothetical protein
LPAAVLELRESVTIAGHGLAGCATAEEQDEGGRD